MLANWIMVVIGSIAIAVLVKAWCDEEIYKAWVEGYFDGYDEACGYDEESTEGSIEAGL